MPRTSRDLLVLQAGDARVVLDPALGGAVLAFSRAGVDILRPTPPDAADVLETACFPLVPYANRIREGRFTFGGRTAALEPNMAGQAHPLHGDGWRGAWRVEARDAATATLAFDAKGSRWPWTYAAQQTVRLSPDGLSLALEVTNLDHEPGPFGIGFHPYFPDAANARLTAEVTGAWMVDADLLPTSWAPGAPFADWAAGSAVRGMALIDHCHTGWDGKATIGWGPERPTLRVTASPELTHLHIYAPPAADFFCIEPVSHAPNALNMADPQAQGVCLLAPGETLRGSMRVEILP